jgi:hypothetical protein
MKNGLSNVSKISKKGHGHFLNQKSEVEIVSIFDRLSKLRLFFVDEDSNEISFLLGI